MHSIVLAFDSVPRNNGSVNQNIGEVARLERDPLRNWITKRCTRSREWRCGELCYADDARSSHFTIHSTQIHIFTRVPVIVTVIVLFRLRIAQNVSTV